MDPMRPVVALSVVALLSAGVSAACSGHTESPPAPSSTDVPVSTETTSAAPKATGHIGDTLTLTRADGSTIAVTLEGVINPATITPAGGDPGATYIATRLKIADPGTVDIDGDVNINVSVFGSDGQRYTPDLNNVSECTNFESGIFRLSPGESAIGCVVFALPQGVTPTKVKYAPSSGFAYDFGEWSLP
ncbi:hypothetical protein A5772_20035 [Mycolicibacter sinensis]|uniref:DUF4352 domain-containing protein n=2 Tax=Mycolicibacter sinensis (strain JDM601) TaxID=875328 RepID=A0A1A2EY86_MYCSD|nr:hypothetical protein A5772_20035 [Mycolicibacter sinensis]OBG09806.1 hypothetical protein A5771_21445 [Mycolicibacter sinensis]